MKGDKEFYRDILKLIIIALLVIIGIGYSIYIGNCDKRVIKSCSVTDKAVKVKGEESKYLIFTEDGNKEIQVFEITDSLIQGRFNSSDMYAEIKVGNTYDFTVVGLRIPLISNYPNIMKISEKGDTK